MGMNMNGIVPGGSFRTGQLGSPIENNSRRSSESSQALNDREKNVSKDTGSTIGSEQSYLLSNTEVSPLKDLDDQLGVQNLDFKNIEISSLTDLDDQLGVQNLDFKNIEISSLTDLMNKLEAFCKYVDDKALHKSLSSNSGIRFDDALEFTENQTYKEALCYTLVASEKSKSLDDSIQIKDMVEKLKYDLMDTAFVGTKNNVTYISDLVNSVQTIINAIKDYTSNHVDLYAAMLLVD